MATRVIFIALEALVGFASLQVKRRDIEHALELLFDCLELSCHHLRDEKTRLPSSSIANIRVHGREESFGSVV